MLRSLISAVMHTSPIVMVVTCVIAIVIASFIWRALKRLWQKVMLLALVPASGGVAGIADTLHTYWNNAQHAGLTVFDYINRIF